MQQNRSNKLTKINIMKTFKHKLSLAAVIAGALAAQAVQAQTVTTIVGGNATQKIIQDRITNAVLQAGSAYYVNSTNSQIFTYVGYLRNDSTYVQLNFNLTGGAGAITDLYSNNPVAIYNNSTAIPTAAVSITGPGTIGLTGAQISSLTQTPTLVSPVVFVINTNLPNSLAGVSNLTSRQAGYLEANGLQSGSGGPALITYDVGGSSLSDPLYFVGRNSLSAVRQVTDANIYYSPFNALVDPVNYPVVNWTTNGTAWAGASSGSQVIAIQNVLSNSIGTVAIGDVPASNYKILSYEGVPFSVTNVETGAYPIWGTERYLYLTSGTYAPTAGQLDAITNLVSAVKNPTFESGNSLFVGKYVPLTGLQVTRDLNYDGGLIALP
jgi:hypothetical protein